MTNSLQKIYRRSELPLADYLMSFQQALRDEFIGDNGTLENAVKFVKPSMSNRADIPEAAKDYLVQNTDGTPDMSKWLARTLKHEHKDKNIFFKESSPDMLARFPTAMKLIEEFGDDCPIANYSILAPNSVINRHTGVENRSGEFIRIHIPLIVPQGDIFFEVNDEVVHWDDIFAFNNQFVHSAHNRTNAWRVCFLIDIRRTRAGLPPGVNYDEVKHLDVFCQQFY
jgi:aspartyl/asparaginyl beta-hydroxylase (cupin superfamily)